MKLFDYTTYLSPFTWRYGSEEMRGIWSEIYKRKLWRKIWVELARSQQKEGLVSQKEFDDLIKHQHDIDIEKAHELEKEIRHDLMAEIKVFASQAKTGGGKIHLGATSMDIEDNTDALRVRESLFLIEENLKKLLEIFKKQITANKDLVCMAYTHLQPAEPTTLGYRFCQYGQDVLLDLKLLRFVLEELKGKGMKGAVGTSASYTFLLNNKKAEKMEQAVMKSLGIDAVAVASQTAPRKLELFVANVLNSIAQSLYKFAFDVRLMQSPGIGEWQEPFGKRQVGSSAMPFKRNPIKSEQICSLARLVFSLKNIATDNAAHMLLERTLDDSANRRVYMPELFLAVDEILRSSIRILDGLEIFKKQIDNNLKIHGPFAGLEAVLLETVKRGADRQEMHEILRVHSLQAYKEMQQTGENPLRQFLSQERKITKYLSVAEIEKLMDPKKHTGLASKKCEEFLEEL